MNELDEANLDKQLREKLEPHGRHPSPAVWGKINTRINQPVASSAPVRPRVWFAAVMGAILLLLIGNLLPNISGTEKQIAFAENSAAAARNSQQTATRQSVKVAPANQAKTGVSAVNAQPEILTRSQPAKSNSASAISSASAIASGAASGPVQPVVSGSAHSAITNTKAYNTERESLVSGQFAEVKTAEIAVPDEVEKENQPTENTTTSETAQPENSTTKIASAPAIPEVLQALVTLEQNLQPIMAQSPETAQSANQIAENLQAQIAELTKLQTRADSLLKKAKNAEILKPLPVASADYEFPNNAPSRWSAALAFAPERSFMSLRAPATDSLTELRKNHETGREGYNASLMFDYQLNDRLSIGAGVGVSSYGAELRITDRETLVNVIYDTTQVTHHQVGSTTSEIITVRIDTVYQLNPVLNSSGQVISYDSIPIISHDSTTFTIVRNDTLTTITETITPLINKTEVTTYKVLKPTYNFVTLPINLRYRLTPGARWWADVGIGAQVQLFRGGSQVITRDGRHYETQKISVKDGPFRPVNLALMGNLALNYALSPRLSVSVAPAVRWQTMSVYKKETGLKQQPFATGLQFGVRFGL